MFAACGPRLELARLVEQIVLDQRLADRDAARLEEGVGHGAADAERVDLAEQVLDDVDLVGHLGAAEDRDERALGVVQRLAEIVDLLVHQQAGGGHRHVLDHALGGGVGAVRGAEGVVDVDVAELGELLGEAGVVLFFLGDGSAGSRAAPRPACRRRRRPGRRSRRRRRPASRGAPPAASRPASGSSPVRSALGPAEVRASRIRPAPCSSAYLMVGSAARIRVSSGDHPALERDVEVDADEDALALENRRP